MGLGICKYCNESMDLSMALGTYVIKTNDSKQSYICIKCCASHVFKDHKDALKDFEQHVQLVKKHLSFESETELNASEKNLYEVLKCAFSKHALNIAKDFEFEKAAGKWLELKMKLKLESVGEFSLAVTDANAEIKEI